MIWMLLFASLLATWQPNTEDDLAGYKVYFGAESGNYSNIVNIGNQTQFRADSLLPGTRYYFAVSAYDLSGNESELSPEVSAVTKAPRPDPDHTGDGRLSGADALEWMRRYVSGDRGWELDHSQNGHVSLADYIQLKYFIMQFYAQQEEIIDDRN